MIKENTVLILGAGASHDYGYPLGSDLKARVADALKESNFQDLLRTGYGVRPAIKNSIESFIESLAKDRALTIDKFLENSSPGFQKIGKVAIAQVIMNCEDENRLFSQTPNWYRVLFSNMNLSQQLHQFGANKISIITFNYDRSLEHYLYASLASEYRSSTEDEIKAQLRRIPIVHVHGRINSLPWEGGRNAREYHKNGFIENLFDLADELMLPKDSGIELERARAIIQDARKIYFVGFGYDTLNLSQLGMPSFKQCPNIFGTCKDIPIHKQSILKGLFPDNSFTFYSPSVDAYDFIMNHFNPNL